MPDTHPTTQQQFEQVMANCRELFCKKLHDYGTARRRKPISQRSRHRRLTTNMPRNVSN